MSALLKRLLDEGLSLLILKGGKTLFSSEKDGMRPLLEAIDRLGLSALGNSVVVDRIVGKAAALLIAYFRAREVYGGLMSVRGRAILRKHGIKSHAERIVPEIINRAGTDICPFEKAVIPVDDPGEGYRRIVEKVAELSGRVGSAAR